MLRINLVLLLCLFILTGCATTNLPEYIKSVHPYSKKISGNQDRIIDAIKVVLFKEGWDIEVQMNPSMFERRSGGEDQSNDVLFVTKPKRVYKGLYWATVHLNVFVFSYADGAEVEIRYESFSPITSGQRNDKLAKILLEQIEQEAKSK